MKKSIPDIQTLTPEQILALPTGHWGDEDLIRLLDEIAEEDNERRDALIEQILRSPELDEMLDYTWIYFELIERYNRQNNTPKLLYWAVAFFTFEVQNGFQSAHHSSYRDIAEHLMYAGDLDSGLSLFAHMLNADPAYAYLYNGLAFGLLNANLHTLLAEVMTRALEVTAQYDPDGLHHQFSDFREEALKEAVAEGSWQERIRPGTLALLRQSLARPLPDPLKALDELPYLMPVHLLAEPDLKDEPGMYRSILAEGRLWFPDLIRALYDRTWVGTPAPRRVLELLRQMRQDHPELDSLANLLDRDLEAGWQERLLSRRIGKIGGYTEEQLQGFAANTELNLHLRSSALNALIERAKWIPEIRAQLIALMRTLLTRPEAQQAEEERFISFLVSDAADMKAVEIYEEIKTAFEEDRVSPDIVDLRDVQEAFGLPVDEKEKIPADQMEVMLVCSDCGRERPHRTRHVLYAVDSKEEGTGTERGSMILDHEITCPKCGAVDRYKISPLSMALLLGPAILSYTQQTGERKGAKGMGKLHPRLYVFQGEIAGMRMHPLDGLDYYRSQIQLFPDDAHLHLKMGNLLRFLTRYDAALEAYRKAYELAPEDDEVVFVRATAEHDFGDPALAQQLYEQVFRLASGGVKALSDHVNFRAAMVGLRDLERGNLSPWDYQLRNSAGVELLPPKRDFSAFISASKPKDKRRHRHKKKS